MMAMVLVEWVRGGGGAWQQVLRRSPTDGACCGVRGGAVPILTMVLAEGVRRGGVAWRVL